MKAGSTIRLFVAGSSEVISTTTSSTSPTSSNIDAVITTPPSPSPITITSTSVPDIPTSGQTPQSTEPPVTRDHTGFIVDGVIVGVVLLSFVMLGFLYIRRRRRLQEAASIQGRMIISRIETAQAHEDGGFGYRPWNEKIPTSEAGPPLSRD
ncbi:hypothetical protein PQX77_015891 [Marasmius sp. AFHP31]|nr:hypothetical protein PQX77_015891 [Marasmius sp. AFHP31]